MSLSLQRLFSMHKQTNYLRIGTMRSEWMKIFQRSLIRKSMASIFDDPTCVTFNQHNSFISKTSTEEKNCRADFLLSTEFPAEK